MQAATVFFNGPLPFHGATKSKVARISRPLRTVRLSMAIASATPETSTVDYSSISSVFPVEACETIGGEACNVEMFPEVKPIETNTTKATRSSEEVEREYIEYNEPKTVFPGEACDDLGGEFCEPEYQEGVFASKTTSS